MKPRIPLASAWMALMLALPLAAHGQTCTNVPQTFPLFAGAVQVGTITVSNDVQKIYLTYTANSGYILDLSNVHVADSAAGIPLTSTGNPNTSRFTYRTTNQPGVTSFTYTIPNRWATQDLALIDIVAQANVQQILTTCNSGGDGSEGSDDHHDGEDHHDGGGDHHSSSARHDSHDSHDGCVVRQTTCGAASGGDDEKSRSGNSSFGSTSGHDGSDSGDDDHEHRSSQCCGPQQVAWTGRQALGNGFFFTYVVSCTIPE